MYKLDSGVPRKPDIVTKTIGIVVILVLTLLLATLFLNYVVYYMIPKVPQQNADTILQQ